MKPPVEIPGSFPRPPGLRGRTAGSHEHSNSEKHSRESVRQEIGPSGHRTDPFPPELFRWPDEPMIRSIASPWWAFSRRRASLRGLGLRQRIAAEDFHLVHDLIGDQPIDGPAER